MKLIKRGQTNSSKFLVIGIINYDVTLSASNTTTDLNSIITLIDKEGHEVVSVSNQLVGRLQVEDAYLWWPYLTHPNPGYLYTLKVGYPVNNPVAVQRGFGAPRNFFSIQGSFFRPNRLNKQIIDLGLNVLQIDRTV